MELVEILLKEIGKYLQEKKINGVVDNYSYSNSVTSGYTACAPIMLVTH